jgi:N-acyl-D-aspartate/D-glutamate deacylase
LEVYYDMLVPESGDEPGVVWKPLGNYQDFDHERMRKIFEHPFSIPGVSDAGAHSGVFNDANGPTHLLTHWVRDRSRGPRFPIEFMVRKQTSEIAKLFGLLDRGELRKGMKADINVIDMDKLELKKPFVAYDLPTGAARWMQHVSGYRMTLVAGQETYRDGEPTTRMPGRLVRNPKSDATQWRGVAAAVAWRPGSTGAGGSMDMKDYALNAAQGGGASAIGRIARALEEDEKEKKPTSRL